MSLGWKTAIMNANTTWKATNASISGSASPQASATRLPIMLGEGTSLVVVATACTILRFWSRRRVSAKYWWDDLFCVLALICSISHFSLYITREVSTRSIYCIELRRSIEYPETRGGLAGHLKDISDIHLRERNISSILALLLMFVYFIGLSLVKTSILFFILRLDARIDSLRLPVYITMSIIATSVIAVCFAAAFQCTPIQRMWDYRVPGKCIDRPKFFMASTWICIVTDVMVYLLPIKLLWQVRLPLKQRIGLVFAFVVGFSVIVMSCLRLESLKNTRDRVNSTWAAVSPTMWGAFELNIAIIVACLPSFKPLISSFSSENHSQKQLCASGLILARVVGDVEQGADSRTTSNTELRGMNQVDVTKPPVAVAASVQSVRRALSDMNLRAIEPSSPL